MHETGRAGGDAGAGRAASSGRRWAGTGDPRADAGLPVRGGRHRDAQPGDRGTDRRRPPDRRGGPPLWAHRDLRVDASRTGPPGRFGRPGPPPPRPATQAHRPPGRPGPGVGRVGVDPAGHRRPAEGGPLGDQRAPRPGRPGPVQDALTPTGDTDIESESSETVAGPDDTIAATSDIEPTAPEPAVTEPAVAGFTGTPVGSARATAGVYRCRYAGAMLLYPYCLLYTSPSPR